MGLWREVYPLGRSFGLIQGGPEAACEALVRELKRSTASTGASVSVLGSVVGPSQAIAALEPLSLPLEDRFIVLGCPGNWSLYLDNSALFDASPPRLADLARSQSRATIYVTSTYPDMADPRPIHQILVFHPGGGLARAVTSQFDHGQWRFFEEGAPYPFEDIASYAVAPPAERFTREHLRAFLANLGVAVSSDSLLAVDEDAPGYLIEQHDPERVGATEYFTLDDLRRTLPEEPSR